MLVFHKIVKNSVFIIGTDSCVPTGNWPVKEHFSYIILIETFIFTIQNVQQTLKIDNDHKTQDTN